MRCSSGWGRRGSLLQQLARGARRAPLVPDPETPRFVQSMELEWPIDALEPLSFVLARLLEPLSEALERADRGAAALRLDLRLVDRTTIARVLQLPAAMRDPQGAADAAAARSRIASAGGRHRCRHDRNRSGASAHHPVLAARARRCRRPKRWRRSPRGCARWSATRAADRRHCSRPIVRMHSKCGRLRRSRKQHVAKSRRVLPPEGGSYADLPGETRVPSPGIPSPEPRIPNPEPGIPNPEPRIPSPEPRIPSPVPGIPNPEPRVPSPEPRTPNPGPRIRHEPRVPSPEPGIPNPEPRVPSPEPGPRTRLRIPNHEPRVPSPEPGIPNPEPRIPSPVLAPVPAAGRRARDGRARPAGAGGDRSSRHAWRGRGAAGRDRGVHRARGGMRATAPGTVTSGMSRSATAHYAGCFAIG